MDRLAIFELIGAGTTKTGLKVESALDTRSYQKGIKVSYAEMKCLGITGDQFHPEWKLHHQTTQAVQIAAVIVRSVLGTDPHIVVSLIGRRHDSPASISRT